MKKNHTNPIEQFKGITTPKILVQRADRLGDLVLALPVIEQLLFHFKQAKLYLLCSNRNVKLIEQCGDIAGYFVFDIHTNPTKAEKESFISDIAKEKFDLYISLWNHPFYQSLGKKAAINLSFGLYRSPLSYYFFSHVIHAKWNNIFTHESDFNLQCLEPLHLSKISPTPLKLIPKSNNLSNLNLPKNKPLLVMFCSSGKVETSISESFFIQLLDYLCKHTFYHIVLTYGDTRFFDTLTSYTHANVTNLNQHLDLHDLMKIIDKSSLYIGPDTGPTHIAHYLNKKSIVIFKSYENPPLRWGPLSDFFRIVRFEYIKDQALKEKIELKSVITELNQLQKQKQPFSMDTKFIKLQQSSLRFGWICKNIKEFQKEKQLIKTKQNEGWKIIVHINRPFFLKNWLCLARKFSYFGLNAFYCSKPPLILKWFNATLYHQCFPNLVISKKPYTSTNS